MLTVTRRFALGATAAATALAASASAQPAAPGQITRNILQRFDFPAQDHATILMVVDIGPNAIVPWHRHPGVESFYVLQGGFDLTFRGDGARPIAATQGMLVPAGTVHMVRNGAANSVLAITYVVEKAQPLVILMPE